MRAGELAGAVEHRHARADRLGTSVSAAHRARSRSRRCAPRRARPAARARRGPRSRGRPARRPRRRSSTPVPAPARRCEGRGRAGSGRAPYGADPTSGYARARGTRDARRLERPPPPARPGRRDLGRRAHPRHRGAGARRADPRAARGAAARASSTPSRSPTTPWPSVHDAELVDYLARAWEDWEAAGLAEDPGQDRVVPYLFPHPGLFGAGSGRARRPRCRRGPASSPTTR